MVSTGEQVKRGEELLHGHIGELALQYEHIYKAHVRLPQGLRLWAPSVAVTESLEHLATVATKVAHLYCNWEQAIGGKDMPQIIEELESIVW